MITQNLDVSLIREQVRTKWYTDARKRISIQDRIGQSVPWWLIVISAVFFALSLPHTAAMFNMLTPVLGLVAPLGIEAGMIYVAFRRYEDKHANRQSAWTVNALGLLVVFVSIVVNGAGSFVAVVDSVNLSGLPFDAMLLRFGTLPATSQMALFLVPMAALIIPLGTYVAGEGLAVLILERREQGDWLDNEWKKVQIEIEFNALRDAGILSGMSPVQANRWSLNVLKIRPQSRADSADSGGHADNPADKSAERIKGEQFYLANLDKIDT